MDLKPTQCRVYLDTPEREILAKFCQDTGLNHSTLLGLFCTAGLRAVKDKGYKLTIPFKIQIEEKTN